MWVTPLELCSTPAGYSIGRQKRPMIISLVNQKGGVGKTTIAVNLASCLSNMGYQTMVIDGDPQGSVLQWQSIENNRSFEVMHYPVPFTKADLLPLIKKYAVLVIDAPPAMGEITRSILALADLAIVPIGPSPLDIWSSKETITLIKEIEKKNRRLRGMLLICRKIARTRVGREAREAMEGYETEVFKTEISQRIAYVEAMISGYSVLEYAPTSEAAAEIRNLGREIIS
jgi:chromosome partitioning protein